HRRVQVLSLDQNNNGDDGLTQIRVRHTDDRRFFNRWVFVEQLLNFFGIDVVATRDDHIFGTSRDLQVTVVVIALVTGDEEPGGTNLLCSFFWVTPVSVKDIGPPYFDGTDIAGRKFRTRFGIGDYDFDAGQC